MNQKKSIIVLTLGASEIQFYREDIENSNFIFSEIPELTPKRFKLTCPNSNTSIELKVNRGYNDRFVLCSPRADGEIVNNNFDNFENIIRFPLIEPLLRKYNSLSAVERIVVVYTNQGEGTSTFYRNNDTIYSARILKKFIDRTYENLTNSKYIELPIIIDVSDIDSNYKLFAKGFYEYFGDENNVDQIFLLPQGGIDQINHALTLQLIQHYKNKVKQLQVTETGVLHELKFSNLFLHDLLKQQIISLSNCGEYLGASKLLLPYQIVNKNYRKLNEIILFAHFRKLFLYKEAIKKANQLYPHEMPNIFGNYCNKIVDNHELVAEFNGNMNVVFNVIERFYIADFNFSLEDYTQFVLSLQIFYEFFVNNYLSVHFNVDLVKNNAREGKVLLTLLKKNYPTLLAKIVNKFNENLKEGDDPMTESKLNVSFPMLALAATFHANDNNHVRVTPILSWLSIINSVIRGGNGIDVARNNIAHKGEGISKDMLHGILSLKKSSEDKNWFKLMDDVKKNLSVSLNPYEELNCLIENALSNT